MRRIGAWRAMAGIALVAGTLLYALVDIGTPALVALAALLVLLIVLAERIHWLERTVLGENDGQVRIPTNWAYWRRPEIVGALLATAFVTVRLAQGPGPGETALLVTSLAAGALVMRRLHTRAWRASGSQWTEECWRDREGRLVRQLHLDASLPEGASRLSHPLHHRRVVLALRASEGCRVEALIAVCGPGEWARQRCSAATGTGAETDQDGDGGTDTKPWLRGSSEGVVHTRNAEAIARTLYRDGRLVLGVPLGGGGRESVVFATDGQGSRSGYAASWRRRRHRRQYRGTTRPETHDPRIPRTTSRVPRLRHSAPRDHIWGWIGAADIRLLRCCAATRRRQAGA